MIGLIRHKTQYGCISMDDLLKLTKELDDCVTESWFVHDIPNELYIELLGYTKRLNRILDNLKKLTVGPYYSHIIGAYHG